MKWNYSIWNEIELFRIKMNKKECSRSVPIRNVPLHREDQRVTIETQHVLSTCSGNLSKFWVGQLDNSTISIFVNYEIKSKNLLMFGVFRIHDLAFFINLIGMPK